MSEPFFILAFRYPESIQPMPQFLVNREGDMSVDDLIQHAARYKDLEQAQRMCQDILAAKLDNELIKSPRLALFKLHLLGLRASGFADIFMRLIFREDVVMDILQCQEPYHEHPPVRIATYPLQWTDWGLDKEPKMVKVVKGEGNFKTALIHNFRLQTDTIADETPEDQFNLFGYFTQGYLTVRIEHQDFKLHPFAKTYAINITDQAVEAMEMETIGEVTKIGADIFINESLDVSTYYQWNAWVNSMLNL